MERLPLTNHQLERLAIALVMAEIDSPDAVVGDIESGFPEGNTIASMLRSGTPVADIAAHIKHTYWNATT